MYCSKIADAIKQTSKTLNYLLTGAFAINNFAVTIIHQKKLFYEYKSFNCNSSE